ncbi:hypothetical protein FE810_05300 [Thalassotalea litorea]|uniref:Uncharacterized protein n=1 Tax=Thalassotalea litorea TaxID=2020715 RepID=A0A5R9IR15_9GAMM|nr:hypothetical protein [Thalassotalea litorea]TLU66923.1 hypothetical protein FE810_05300 [Thalassotalea litorea]
MEFLITPLIGIGPIKLGMLRDEIKEVLNDFFDSTRGDIDYYFNGNLQVEFDESRASFIGIAFDNSYTVFFEGVNVFDIDAVELFSLIASKESDRHRFNPSEYVFPEQILSLWDADEQYDYIGSHQRVVWAQIGLGSSSYLKAINELI